MWRCARVVECITLLTAHVAEGEWNGAQSLLPPWVIDGLEEMVFFPQGLVEGFITPYAAPLLHFSQQE